MELEDIRKKYQCDEGRTFAQWKEWVRKNKPSQAETHIVTAVAPNGSKFEKLIGGYTDAQNSAFSLVAHGYKNVKMFKSVNAGPMKLLRNFSAPLHGAKFKDEADSVDEIREKYAKDAAFGVKVKGNEKGSERLTMEKVFKELSPAPAWKKVKKGNTIVIRTNINGKDQDVVTIKYFNPNIVAMTPKGGASNMVALKDVTVMCSKLGVEGRRSYNDSADGVEQIRAKYQSDAMVSKSELEKKKYTQFFVNGEDIYGKVLRIPQRRFRKFEDAVRAAKSLQNANTGHVFVEGGWDNNQIEPKALYDWRNPKAK